MDESEKHENALWIVAETEVIAERVEVEGRRGGVERGSGFGVPGRVFEAEERIVKRDRVSVSADKVKAQMKGMIAIVNDLFDDASARTGLQLDEVELSVEINAEGNVSLLGTGGTLGSKGGMTLKFVRPK